MTKFTKILAAVVAASAVLSFAGCSNKDNSSDSSSSSASDSSAAASTAEASTASSAEVSAPATAEADASTTAEVSAPATAEAAAFDVSKLYGEWILAGVNDGTQTMNVADFAASLGVDAESCMVSVVIDETSYTYTTVAGSAVYTYTANENGITVDMGGVEVANIYGEEADTIMYQTANDTATYTYILMRNTDDAASTAQAYATIEG